MLNGTSILTVRFALVRTMWSNFKETVLSDNENDTNIDMSSVLDVPQDHLQQFMRGEVSFQSLAAMGPASSSSKANQAITAADGPWEMLQTPNIFCQSSSETESSLVGMLAGTSSSAMPVEAVTNIQSQLSSSSKASEEEPFRSPPSTSENFMELSTVTPIPIKHSPSGIIAERNSRKESLTEEENLTYLDWYDQSHSKTHNEVIQTGETSAASKPQLSKVADISRQFKIVIGEGDDDDESSAIIHLNVPSLTPESADILQENMVVDDATSKQNADIVDEKDDSDLEDQQMVWRIQQDLDMDLFKECKKQSKKGSSTKLPKEVRGLMGEANLCYARGDHDDAIKMCMEVIRLAPYASESYETLSMVYDEQGQAERSLQYSLLAAHLSKPDAEQWLHLAQMCLDQGDDTKALNCFTKASKLRPQDHHIVLECAKLQRKLGNFSKAMMLYKNSIRITPKEEGESAVHLARDLSKECHEKKANQLGISLLEEVFQHHLELFRDEDANLLCELYLLEDQLNSVLEHLVKHCKLEVTREDESLESDFSTIIRISVPESMAVDLSCKVAIAGIRMGRHELVQEVAKTITCLDPSDVGDLQFDLAETYMTSKDFAHALNILNTLVSSQDYASFAAVWLRHAQCHRMLSNLDRAIHSYKQCVKLAPNHVDAHLLYSQTLRSVSKFHEAIQTLDVAEKYEIDPEEHMQLHLERYTVLKFWSEKNKNKLTLAADVSLLIFANRLRHTAFKEGKFTVTRREVPHSNAMAGSIKLRRQAHAYDELRELKGIYLKGDPSYLSKEQLIKLFKETVDILMKCQRYRDAINLAEAVQWCNKCCEFPNARKYFEQVTFCACMLSGNYQKAYTIIRQWLHLRLRCDEKCDHLWNIFGMLIAKTGDHRHQKFCLRFLLKNPDNVALMVLNGHNCLASGCYKAALREYYHAHLKMSDEPLYILMLGVVYINIASQKYSVCKHSLIAQGLACFEKYLKLRQFDQECYYNIGRAMHQVGLGHFAIQYYERALRSPVPVVEKTADGEDNTMDFDLRMEIAYNLSLIYRASGNIALANQTLCKLCVI